MSGLRVDSLAVTKLIAVLGLGWGPSPLSAQQQVHVVVTAVPNPLPAGTCTGIWVEVRDEFNQRINKLASGLALHSRSYDYSQPNAVDFSWKNNDPSIGYLCARMTAGAVATVVTAAIRGTSYSGSTVVTVQPATPEPGAVANAAPGAAPANPAVHPPASGDPAGRPYPPPSPTSSAGAPQPANGQPPATAATDPAQPYPPSGYPAPSSPPAPPAPVPITPAVGAPSTTTTGTGTSAPPAPAQADTGLKSGGGLLRKIGDHTKRKVGQVKAETADNLAAATTEVIDTTLESGSGVITSTAAEASSTARMRIGEAGKSLMPAAQRGGVSSDNLAIALASGRAVLRSMRFTGTTDVLEPSARELAKRLAAALEAIPGTFLIEAHVDAMESPAAAQELSEHRAAAVKTALIKQGIPVVRLTAVGYGATRPMPEVPADGGPPSSARIEVARTQ